jgi:hypothetical protein
MGGGKESVALLEYMIRTYILTVNEDWITLNEEI